MKALLIAIFAVLVHGGASAQIYESEDSEGVPEFSDMPSEGAQVVDLPEANVMEAPPEPITPATAEPAPAAPVRVNTAGTAGADQDEEYPEIIYRGDHEDQRRAREAVKEHYENHHKVYDPGATVEPHAGEAAGHKVKGGAAGGHHGGRR